MSKGLGSIDRDISTIETAYAGNPQALSSKIQKDRSRGVSQSLLELMALEKMNAEKDAIKNQMILDSPQQGIETVADQVRGTAKNNAEQEILSGVAKALAMKQSAKQKRANQLLKTPTNRLMSGISKPMMDPRTVGLGKVRRPNFQRAAKGGIIGYNEAGLVEKIMSGAKNIGSNVKEKLDSVVNSYEFKMYKAKLKEKFGDTVDAVSNSQLLESFLEGGADLIDNVVDTAGPAISSAKEQITPFVETQVDRLKNLGKLDEEKLKNQTQMMDKFLDAGKSITGESGDTPGLFVTGDAGNPIFKFPNSLPEFMKYTTPGISASDEFDEAYDLRDQNKPANLPEKIKMGLDSAITKFKGTNLEGLENMGQDPVGLAAMQMAPTVSDNVSKAVKSGLDMGKSAINTYLDPNFPSNESKEAVADFINSNVIPYDPTGLLDYIDPKSTASPNFNTTGIDQAKKFGSNLIDSAVQTFDSLANVFFPDSKPDNTTISDSAELVTTDNTEDLVNLSTTELITKKDEQKEVTKELDVTEKDVIDDTETLENEKVKLKDGSVASVYDPEQMIGINDPKGGSDQTNAGLAELVEKTQNKGKTTTNGTKSKVTTSNTGSLNSSTSIADAYMKAINDLKGKRSKLDRLIYAWGNFKRTGSGLGGSSAAAGMRYDAFLDKKDQAVLGKFFDLKMQEFKINATLSAARMRSGGIGGLKGLKNIATLNKNNLNITKAMGERIDAVKATPEYQFLQQSINETNGKLEEMRKRGGFENNKDYVSLMDKLTEDQNMAKLLILEDATYIMLAGQQIINNNLMEASSGTTGDIDTNTDPVEVE